MGKRAIQVELMLVNPLARQNVGARGMRYEAPGVVVDERPVLIGHGGTTVGVSQCIVVIS